MTPLERIKFLAFFNIIQSEEKRVEIIIGILKAELVEEAAHFKYSNLLPKGIVISKQAIRDALKGRGEKLRRPGCASDLVRQNAAKLLQIQPYELWSNLYHPPANNNLT